MVMRRGLTVTLLVVGAAAAAAELAFAHSSPACFASTPAGISGSKATAFRRAFSAGPAPLLLAPAPRHAALAPLLAKRKRKAEEASGDDEDEGTSSPSFSMDGGLPMGGIPLPSEQAEAETFAAIKKLVANRDTALEAKFDIPKEAIVEDNFQFRKDKNQKIQDDADAIFGLSGEMSRLVKKGTWACVAILVAAEVLAQTPLATIFTPPGVTVQGELQKRRAASSKGEMLPGNRPLKPYAFGGLSPPPPGITDLPGNT